MIQTKSQSSLGLTALDARYVNVVGDTMTGNLVISNTAPSLTFTDTTASAKSMVISVDANGADFRESTGASGSLLFLDLANKRLGVGTKVFTGTIAGVGNDVFKVQGANGALMGFNDFGSGYVWFGVKSASGLVSAYGAMCFTTYVSFGSATDHPVHFRVFNSSRMDINNKGQVRIGSNLATPSTHSAQLEVQSGLSTTITSLIQGAASQSANLTEWQNSSAAVQASVAPDGHITVGGTYSLDSTIKVRGYNGTNSPGLFAAMPNGVGSASYYGGTNNGSVFSFFGTDFQADTSNFTRILFVASADSSGLLASGNGTVGIKPLYIGSYNDATAVTTKWMIFKTTGNIELPIDNQLFTFGTGQDATISYDGTNLIINPKLVGTGYLSVLGDVNPVNVDASGAYKVDGVQVVSNRVVDARIDDTPNSGDATTDGIIAAIQSILQTHGLAAAA